MAAHPLANALIGRIGLPIIAGACVAGASAVLLAVAEPIWIALLFAALIVLLPSLVVAEPMTYWFIVFLAVLPFDIAKMFGEQATAFGRLETYGATWGGVAPALSLHLLDLALIPLFGVWLLGKLRRRESIRFPRIGFIPLAYLCFTTVTAFVAPYPYYAFIKLIQMWTFFGIYVFAVDAVDLRKLGRPMLVILMLTLSMQGAVTAARYALQADETALGAAFGQTSKYDYIRKNEEAISVTAGESDSATRGRGTFGSPNATAMHIELLMPFAVALLLLERSRRRRTFYAAIIALGVIGHLATFSRAGILALIASTAVCCCIAAFRGWIPRRLLPALVGGALLAGALLLPFLAGFLSTRPEFLSIHIDHLKQGIQVAMHHPIFGVGLNNASVVRPYLVPEGLGHGENLLPMHSSYLIALSETGLVGATLFIGFFAMATLEAFRRSASSDTTTRIFSLGILGALVAMSIHNITDVAGPHALQAMWWLYAGIAIGSAPDAKRPSASEARAVA